MDPTKRAFLKKSLLLAATTSASLPLVVRGSAKAPDIQIGIIGTGNRGTGLGKVLNRIEGMRVAAICDPLPFRLEKAAKDFALPKQSQYTLHTDLLENKKVDAVIIATPYTLHNQISLDAMHAEKHIYCEKTMSAGKQGTAELVMAARNYKKVFQTGHQYRSAPRIKQAVQMVKSGYLGEIAQITAVWNRNGNWRRKVPDPAFERQVNWRMYREYSGGLAAELSSHHIDVANWIAGQSPVQVTGFGGIDYWKDGRETYDNINLLTRYANGIKANYTCLTTNARENRYIKVFGSKGTVVIGAQDTYVYSEKIEQQIEKGLVDGVSGATLKAWKDNKGITLPRDEKDASWHALNDFKQAINTGIQPLSNLSTGAQVSYVVQMALDAMDNNKIETWQPEYRL